MLIAPMMMAAIVIGSAAIVKPSSTAGMPGTVGLQQKLACVRQIFCSPT